MGYSLSHSFGAVFDNPDLIVACVVGDGEAETGPLATAWHSNKFLNPVTDGAVLPILHLNGYKIANPTILARITHEELDQLLRGYGWTPYFVEGDEPAMMHEAMAATLDTVVEQIRVIQTDARVHGNAARPRWPMIVLKSPKGWTGPKASTGCRSKAPSTRTRCRSPIPPRIPSTCSYWRTGCGAIGRTNSLTSSGRLKPELAELAPKGERRMGANPHANGGMLLRDLRMPDFRDYAVDVPVPGVQAIGDTHVLGRFLRDVTKLNDEQRNFRVFGPDETLSNGLEAVFEVTKRQWNAATRANDEYLGADRARDGDAQRAPVRGLAGRLPAHRAPRAVQLLRGVHPHRRFDVQPARQVAEGDARTAVAAQDRLVELPAGLARLAAGPQRLHAPGSRVSSTTW